MQKTLHRYVALIRAINVGGYSIIKMDKLRKLFESFGFTDAATYIQTGNVLFSSEDDDAEQLARHLEEKLTSSVGRQMTVFVLTPAELKRAAANNPFEPQCQDQELICNLMFLSAEPEASRRETLMTLQGQEYRFQVQDKVLYYAYSREDAGNRRTINFEKVLGVTGTARNLNVVNKLIELIG